MCVCVQKGSRQSISIPVQQPLGFSALPSTVMTSSLVQSVMEAFSSPTVTARCPTHIKIQLEKLYFPSRACVLSACFLRKWLWFHYALQVLIKLSCECPIIFFLKIKHCICVFLLWIWMEEFSSSFELCVDLHLNCLALFCWYRQMDIFSFCIIF